MITLRPQSKPYIDKPFYLKLSILGKADGETTLTIHDSIFKHTTRVISSEGELVTYIRTVGQILDADKVWDHPSMDVFNFAELPKKASTGVSVTATQGNEEEAMDQL